MCTSLLEYDSPKPARSRDTQAVDTYLLATRSTPVYNTGGKRRDRIQVFMDQFYKDRGVWRFLEISRACLLLISCREAV